MQNRIHLIMSIVLLSSLFQCSSEINVLRNGEKAPSFESQLISGEHVSLSDFEGQYVLLDFWGSWCAPCRKSNPKWVELYDTLKKVKFKKATGFEIVSIGLEKNEKAWKAAIEADNLKWKYHILELEDPTDIGAQVIANLYQIKQLPSSFLINPKGIIVGVNLSPDEVSKLLKRQTLQ